jgi:hypothetical protein
VLFFSIILTSFFSFQALCTSVTLFSKAAFDKGLS